MCLWKRERTYLFLPHETTLVRQPHYVGGRCADKLEEYTAVLGNRVSLDSIAGTYCGMLPPNVETILTLNANGTYLLIRTFKEKQNEREFLRGTFQVLDGNILMLVHPSSGDNILYRVRGDKSVFYWIRLATNLKKRIVRVRAKALSFVWSFKAFALTIIFALGKIKR